MKRCFIHLKNGLNAYCVLDSLGNRIIDECYLINVSARYIGANLSERSIRRLKRLDIVEKIEPDLGFLPVTKF